MLLRTQTALFHPLWGLITGVIYLSLISAPPPPLSFSLIHSLMFSLSAMSVCPVTHRDKLSSSIHLRECELNTNFTSNQVLITRV